MQRSNWRRQGEASRADADGTDRREERREREGSLAEWLPPVQLATRKSYGGARSCISY